eukprot:1153234-Pelagomonas_calceolata.AAC.3
MQGLSGPFQTLLTHAQPFLPTPSGMCTNIRFKRENECGDKTGPAIMLQSGWCVCGSGASGRMGAVR